MPSKTYTISTRIEVTEEFKKYFSEYKTEYNRIYRIMWHKMTDPSYRTKYPKDSYFVTEICQEYDLLKRTVNSLRYDIKGRMKSYQELKKTEQKQLQIKIAQKIRKIEEICEKINRLKPLITANKSTKKQLETYRNLKKSLYWQKNKLNAMKQKEKQLEYEIKNQKYSLGFGSKQLFQKQNRLEENGYVIHLQWYQDYQNARDKNIFYLGSSDETCGNQMFQMRYEEETKEFSVKIRKEKKYCKTNHPIENYIQLEHLKFKHLQEELVGVVTSYEDSRKGSTPLSYRLVNKGKKWYFQVMFAIQYENYETFSSYGTVGLDYNDGFIELSETDACGNLIFQEHYPLLLHGTGKKAENEIRTTVATIVADAKRKGKDIVIEDLSFVKTKAKITSAKGQKGKNYNRMLHAFDSSRYIFTIENACHRNQVCLQKINPWNTSKIGKQKYANHKKLNIHQAASYVIARKGQGFVDLLQKAK